MKSRNLKTINKVAQRTYALVASIGLTDATKRPDSSLTKSEIAWWRESYFLGRRLDWRQASLRSLSRRYRALYKGALGMVRIAATPSH